MKLGLAADEAQKTPLHVLHVYLQFNVEHCFYLIKKLLQISSAFPDKSGHDNGAPVVFKCKYFLY